MSMSVVWAGDPHSIMRTYQTTVSILRCICDGSAKGIKIETAVIKDKKSKNRWWRAWPPFRFVQSKLPHQLFYRYNNTLLEEENFQIRNLKDERMGWQNDTEKALYCMVLGPLLCSGRVGRRSAGHGHHHNRVFRFCRSSQSSDVKGT